MATFEEMATAALAGEALLLRSMVQDWLGQLQGSQDWSKPRTSDPKVLAVAAALAELFADRLQRDPPDWSREVGGVSEPIFLVRSAQTMRRLRTLCEKESPLPFKKRGLFVPPNYLQFA